MHLMELILMDIYEVVIVQGLIGYVEAKFLHNISLVSRMNSTLIKFVHRSRDLLYTGRDEVCANYSPQKGMFEIF